jgi:hypothetical protein
MATTAMGVFAPRPAWADETSPANVAAARKHFERARADYAQGEYREAINELDAAHTLDPNAKDLVFNLGVVHEKLGDIDDALRWFRLYTTMNLTPAERDRADAYVTRLEGAKKEVEDKQAAAAAAAASGAHTPVPPPPAKTTSSGPRVHTILTYGAAGITVAALGFGTVFGIKAESDRPPTPYITGRNGTYADLVDGQANAHREAVVADIGFGVAIAGAAATTALFFTLPRSTTTTGSTSVSAAPLAGGGAFFVQGSF